MNSLTTGTIEQIFELKFDFEELHTKMLELIREAGEKKLKGFDIDIDEFDKEAISLIGRYETDFSREVTSATRECPEEIVLERQYFREEVDIDQLLQDHAKELIGCLKLNTYETENDAIYLIDGEDQGSVFEDMFDDEDF